MYKSWNKRFNLNMRYGKLIYKFCGMLLLFSTVLIFRLLIERNRLSHLDLITVTNLLDQLFIIWLGFILIFSKISSLAELVTQRKILLPLVLSVTFGLALTIMHNIELTSRVRTSLSQSRTAASAPTFCTRPTSPDPRCWGTH
jgi:hypothetical protein